MLILRLFHNYRVAQTKMKSDHQCPGRELLIPKSGNRTISGVRSRRHTPWPGNLDPGLTESPKLKVAPPTKWRVRKEWGKNWLLSRVSKEDSVRQRCSGDFSPRPPPPFPLNPNLAPGLPYPPPSQIRIGPKEFFDFFAELELSSGFSRPALWKYNATCATSVCAESISFVVEKSS